MTYRGKVRGRRTELDEQVEVLEQGEYGAATAKGRGAGKRGAKDAPTLYDRLKPFVGQAKGLPADMSVNHDHYLYGVAKRK